MVDGLRKVSVSLQLHQYRPPACEMQGLMRSGLLLGPSPEDRRDDYFGWRILQMRNVHALYSVDASPLSNANAKLLVSATFPLPISTEYFGIAVSWLLLSHISLSSPLRQMSRPVR